jgi:peroxiredoxin
MLRHCFTLLGLLALLLCSGSQAGQYNKKINHGDPAPVWSDLPGVDGRKHSLADLKDKDVVVVIFTCNSCPAAVGYEGRIKELVKKYASGPDSKVGIVAINVNTIPEDRLDKMTERAKAEKFNFPYLYDESQKIAKAYGATYTPEFFVLNKERRIVYMGAMDDRNKAEDAKVKYLEPAIDATLAGKKVETVETIGRGCLIRYLRERKD